MLCENIRFLVSQYVIIDNLSSAHNITAMMYKHLHGILNNNLIPFIDIHLTLQDWVIREDAEKLIKVFFHAWK